MATLIPSLNSCISRMTKGEKRLAQRLIDKLENDYLCWYEVPVGTRSRYPDFIILHPKRGLLVLEVKDWHLETILAADPHSVTRITSTGQKIDPNPIAQARGYVRALLSQMENDPHLKVPEGRYQGKLIFPWGFGVVLSNITRQQFLKTNLCEAIDPNLIIFKDDLAETIDTEKFQMLLWKMFKIEFNRTLTMPEIERIRWHLFPEIRVEQHQLSLLQQGTSDCSIQDTVPDIIRIMDLQQEQLARGLGQGHRVIHGTAGSGKTMILVYRVQYLAKIVQKPILVLCYNVPLATRLEQIVRDKNLHQAVSVRNFHAWCRDQLTLYHQSLPESTTDKNKYSEQLVSNVIAGVDCGLIPKAQYGAVLVDEGHDFQPDWLRLIVRMIDPETNYLLLLYDDAQSIYGSSHTQKFSFASVGIQARGRTSIFRINYRNTAEVLAVAYEFIKDTLNPHEADEDSIPIVSPESAGRHGVVPIISRRSNLTLEIDCIIEQFLKYHADGIAWRDMAIIYRIGFMGKETVEGLRKAAIPFEWLHETGKNRRFDSSEDSVKVITLHSSKGLEFSVVAIPGIGYMPWKAFDPAEEARLLYVGMTRAMDNLILTYHADSAFAQQLISARERVLAS